MLIGGNAADSGTRAGQSGLEMMLSRLSEVELEQVMKSLGAGCEGGKEEIEALSYRDIFSIDKEGRLFIRIPAHLHHVLLGPRVKAFMARHAARPAVEGISASDDKSNICADCGASMTMTGSLANTTDVVEKTVIVDSNPYLYEDIFHKEQKGRSGINNHSSAVREEHPPRLIEWKGMQPGSDSYYLGPGSGHRGIVPAG